MTDHADMLEGLLSDETLSYDEEQALRAAIALMREQSEPVAWQLRRTDGSPLAVWENCTKKCHDETIRTGRYMGYANGPASEARALCVIPAPPRDSCDEQEPAE